MRSLYPSAPPVVTVSGVEPPRECRAENQFEVLWVAGELSNVKKAPSGHWYFCLKDPTAQIDCAMFRTRAQFLDFRPENGQQVEVRARVTLYEPRGSYQLVVEEIRKAGLGALYEAFEKLKAKLQAEGLFEAERKKPPPAFPRAIGIVTSAAGGRLRDVLTTLARRARMVPVILYPAQVQGETAAAQIARAIAVANARAEVDVLIVCRGGGSLEDLWAFNEEVVARAIAASVLPDRERRGPRDRFLDQRFRRRPARAHADRRGGRREPRPRKPLRTRSPQCAGASVAMSVASSRSARSGSTAPRAGFSRPPSGWRASASASATSGGG